MIQKYITKPEVIEAVQFNGNFEEIEQFCGGDAGIRNGVVVVATLDGAMHVLPKDYIIKDINGRFHPCNPDTFDKNYNIVGDFIGIDLASGPDYIGLSYQHTR